MKPSAAPACINAMTRLLPAVRAETARRLVRAGLHQARIAEHLGVSQAMVSKYLRRTPPADALVPAKLVTDLVENSVRRAMREEEKGTIPPWCPVCESFSEAGFFCSLKGLPGLHECLRQEQAPTEGSAKRVLSNLQAAADEMRGLPLQPLVPQVRTNIAMALPGATTAREVAAFPGRFIELRGNLREAAPPEFGASSHLAQLLLKVRRTHPHVGAILNLRYGDDVQRVLKRAKLRAQILPRSRKELVVSLPRDTPIDALIDAGAFGIEPALYVLGETATDALARVQRILINLPKENHA